jgi:hypothetical protein
MDKVLIYIVILCWVISSLYVMRWHYQRGDLDLGTIILAITLAPILSIIIRDNKKEEEKHTIGRHHYIEENDRHRRWFQTNSPYNRNEIPNYGRTIPPPPPISQKKQKIKDFKFLKG